MNNPFIFDRPNTIDVDEFIKFYIKDNIYTRFLESTRNIIIIGVRGSGKTSTLRYYSFPVQYKNPDVKDKFSIIGIYIPNKHPILGKREYLLYENIDKQFVVVEHFLCINILSNICDTFIDSYEYLKFEKETENKILTNLSYIFETSFPDTGSLFENLKLFITKESNASQRKLNNNNFESFVDYSFSFNNTIIPFLEQIRLIPSLNNSHFSLFFDDIQDLGEIHKKIINSWIAYRDNKLFSFKIATAEIKPLYTTSTNGVILEGHDFVKLDMTRRIFNKASEFNSFAREVISRRLQLAGIENNVDEFLPVADSFNDGLKKAKIKAKKMAQKKYPHPKGTQINDYVAKYGRAIFFRERNPKANLPTYSGIDTIIDISTGVIRNLLTPIFFMYEKQLANNKNKNEIVLTIPPSVQKEIIIKRSESFWERIRNIDSEIDNCTKEVALQINNFFNQLMIYLKKRLKDDKISEPRAINFIITQYSSEEEKTKINELINASLRSTLLYQRLVSHKATGEKIPLFIPNRLMLPVHGLDPHGQYSHFPISAKSFLNAAENNIEIPLFTENKIDDKQLEIEF